MRPQFIALDTVESTMTEAAERLAAGTLAPWTVILANHQTGGRGRRNREWVTEPGDALLATIFVPLQLPPDRSGLLAIAVGTAIAEALQEWGVAVSLKWPNDINLADRKLGGVLIHLIHAQLGANALIGIGINLRSTPAVLGASAACLAQVLPDPPAPLALARAIVRHCQSAVASLEAGDWQSIRMNWMHRALWLNERISVRTDIDVVGRLVGIDEFGHLVLKTEEGIQSIATGDVERGPRLPD